MDKSEEYAKMCDTIELQADRTLKDEDFVYHEDCGIQLFVNVFMGFSPLKGDPLPKLRWIPTQSQLQEIILSNTDKTDFVRLLEDFYWYWTGYNSDLPHYDYIAEEDKSKMREDFKSMEQLWLAFLMEELHNKAWNGEKWIKK